MTLYAMIDKGGVVIETFEPHSGFTDIADFFPAETAALFVPCPDETMQGSVKNSDGSWTHPPPPDPPDPEPEPASAPPKA